MSASIVEFLRKKDYRLIRELGEGACGKTVLLHDDLIDESFVCKKYVPYDPTQREVLFKNFVQEIKLLHLLYHEHVVRVFNYFIYPEYHSGYILMEHVKGAEIDEYLEKNPEKFNELFVQAVSGFAYLEAHDILHRDIRTQNVMVTEPGVLKIIDFGFGKKVIDPEDFGKSISLNWWCETPNEFVDKVYDFATEVYFVGKLFEKLLIEKEIEHFRYQAILREMCSPDPKRRIASFAEINRTISSDKFVEINFADGELSAYRSFSQHLFDAINKLERNAKYFEDTERVQANLEALYKRVMLEESIPDNSSLVRIFVNGSYYYNKIQTVPVYVLKGFMDLLRACSKEKRNIVINNVHSKLDAAPRYDPKKVDDFDDDIPF